MQISIESKLNENINDDGLDGIESEDKRTQKERRKSRTKINDSLSNVFISNTNKINFDRIAN